MFTNHFRTDKTYIKKKAIYGDPPLYLRLVDKRFMSFKRQCKELSIYMCIYVHVILYSKIVELINQ